MINGLTKERYENFIKEQDEMNDLLEERGDEIIKELKKNSIELGLRHCSYMDCGLDSFRLAEIAYEDDNYSRTLPLDILFSDEALKAYIDCEIEKRVKKREYDEKRRREKEEKKKQIKEERERKEYERLRAKFEGE